MTTAPKEHYLAEFSKLTATGHPMPWLLDLRKKAILEFEQLGFPTRRHEEWKYTRTDKIENYVFTSAPYLNDVVTLSQLHPFLLASEDVYRLVFINSHFSTALSTIPSAIPGVTLMNLSTASTQHTTDITVNLSRHTKQAHAFTALNTAFMRDGVYLQISPNVKLAKPIHILYVSTAAKEPLVNYTRNLIIAGVRSKATILEHYVSLTQECHFTNTLTQIVLEPHASLEHVKLQQENSQAFHIGTIQCQQQRDSQLLAHTLTLGGALVRSDTHTQLLEEGASCTLNGLYRVKGQQHVDHHTSIEHVKPHGTSREHYKGVLSDKARAVFNGKVIVCQDAQKTDAQQSNENLLLSKETEVDTKPELEIYADDVKCRHGATVGQLDENALFYLQSRGISSESAHDLLIHAFLQELVEQINDPVIQEKAKNAIINYERTL